MPCQNRGKERNGPHPRREGGTEASNFTLNKYPGLRGGKKTTSRITFSDVYIKHCEVRAYDIYSSVNTRTAQIHLIYRELYQ